MLDEATLDRIAKRIARGESEGRVGKIVYAVVVEAFGNFLPAIATYVAKGQFSGSLLGVPWSFSYRVVKGGSGASLRTRAIRIVRKNEKDEGIRLSTEDFNYAVEQVRGMLERSEQVSMIVGDDNAR